MKYDEWNRISFAGHLTASFYGGTLVSPLPFSFLFQGGHSVWPEGLGTWDLIVLMGGLNIRHDGSKINEFKKYMFDPFCTQY